jgi:chlorite dismutase
MSNRLFTFLGGETGTWEIVNITTLAGHPLATASKLDIISGLPDSSSSESEWFLHGIISNERYVTREEKEGLIVKQPHLGRSQAVCAAMICIGKNPSWWLLSQDERRQIFEQDSKHITIGMNYLPAIARRLYHCRDLGENEPFDFITWFEYAESDSSAFDDLLVELRLSQEWQYVDREVDIRLIRRILT